MQVTTTKAVRLNMLIARKVYAGNIPCLQRDTAETAKADPWLLITNEVGRVGKDRRLQRQLEPTRKDKHMRSSLLFVIRLLVTSQRRCAAWAATKSGIPEDMVAVSICGQLKAMLSITARDVTLNI
jgi:hypothetical protein